jgi:hypothetical protein
VLQNQRSTYRYNLKKYAINMCEAVRVRLLKKVEQQQIDKGDKPHAPAALATVHTETETELTWTWWQ